MQSDAPRKLFLGCTLSLALVCSGYSSWTLLQPLGTGSFAIEPLATDAPHTQIATGITFAPSVAFGHTLGGYFDTPKDFTTYSTPPWTFGMVMKLTSISEHIFYSVELYDSAFSRIDTYMGDTGDLVVGTSTFSTLDLIAGTGTGDYSDVAALQLTWNGGTSMNLTVESISAVPEPNTLALLGLGAAGLAILRGRNRKRLGR